MIWMRVVTLKFCPTLQTISCLRRLLCIVCIAGVRWTVFLLVSFHWDLLRLFNGLVLD